MRKGTSTREALCLQGMASLFGQHKWYLPETGHSLTRAHNSSTQIVMNACPVHLLSPMPCSWAALMSLRTIVLGQWALGHPSLS